MPGCQSQDEGTAADQGGMVLTGSPPFATPSRNTRASACRSNGLRPNPVPRNRRPVDWPTDRRPPLRRSRRAAHDERVMRPPAIGEQGAGFRSLGDAWADTTTPHGRLMLTVVGDLAEFERELIREAVRRRQAGETLMEIARTYNVSHSTISRLS
jgi:resolvase-like protein